MKLLEQHHEKLSQLLKFKISQPASLSVENIPELKTVLQAPSSPPSEKTLDGPHHRLPQSNPPLPFIPQREISSSIASNLATARGIPSNRQRRSIGPVNLTSHSQESKILTSPRRSRPKEPIHKLPETPSPNKSQDMQTLKKLPLVPTRKFYSQIVVLLLHHPGAMSHFKNSMPLLKGFSPNSLPPWLLLDSH